MKRSNEGLLTGNNIIKKHAPIIPGLNLLENFITEEEETILLAHIDKSPWSNAISRRTQHYGYIYNYSSRNLALESTDPIPPWCNGIIDRLTDQPNQLIINEYKPGQGIAGHIDHIRYFGDGIVSISLGSDTIMDFSRDTTKKSIQLPQRSALILHGEARYKWRHGISGGNVRKRRVSLTFRVVESKK
jgi:alkylated DNA repair dioxygenase AlkB